MNLFVADRIPVVPPTVLSSSGALYRALADAPALPVSQSRFAGYTDVDQARAEFMRDPRVRLLMDNGAALEGSPGAIGAAWEMNYDSWPVRQAKPTPYYFGPRGRLLDGKPKGSGRENYLADPSARPPQTLNGDDEADAWRAEPPYDWAPIAKRRGTGLHEPRPAQGHRDRRCVEPRRRTCESSRADTDLQATLTEVRPDGRETYVQNGWLRASHRKLDLEASTVNDPMPTHFREDAEPLPTRPVHARQGADLSRRPRVPRRLPATGHDLGGRWGPAALGLPDGRPREGPATRSCSGASGRRESSCRSSAERTRREPPSPGRPPCGGSPAGSTRPLSEPGG